MNIRSRLSLSFGLIVASILLLFSISIYYFSSYYRATEFFGRLKNHGITTAQILVDARVVDSTRLQEIDKNTLNMLFDENMVIYNNENKVVYGYSKERNPYFHPTSFLNDIRLENEVRVRENDKETIGFLYNGKYDHFVIVVTASDKYGLSEIKNLEWILAIGFLLTIAITFFTGWFFAGQALQPMARITDEANQITASKLNLRIHEGNKTDELARLAITFNSMLDRLEKSFQMQRSFVSNASHELRTPLTSISGQLEVALMKSRTETEYTEILSSLLEDIKNMSKLSNDLLDLARASADTSFFKLVPVRIDEQLFFARESLLRTVPSFKINIEFKNFPSEENKLSLLGNEQLLKSAFLNLMDNACKYSPDHTVDILFDYSENQQIEITFSDKGIGIPEGEIEKILQPFYRASNSISKKGHGLGLALTIKFIEVHQGRLVIHSELQQGTSIKIILPTLS